MHYLAPIPMLYVDCSGVPCDGGSVDVYRNGTQEHAPIYQNSATDELAENPAMLDSNGMWKAFIDANVALDYIVKDRDGNVVASFVNISLDFGSGQGGVSKAYVDARDDEIRESVVGVSGALEDERERAISSESEESAARESGDADNAAEIARVEVNGLKIAPPEHEGVGTMLFYKGTLI